MNSCTWPCTVTRTRRSHAEGAAAPTSEECTEAVPGASVSPLTDISGSATAADPVEPVSPDVLSDNHCPDYDCSEQSSGSTKACLEGSLHSVSPKPIGSAGAGDIPTANVPMAASAAPLPLCPQCGSSKTWNIYGARTGRFACMVSHHHFYGSKSGDGPSTRSQASSHEIAQVA